MLDATRDDQAQATLAARFPNAIVVLNKIDQAIAAWTAEKIGTQELSAICARTGAGISDLIVRVHDRFGIDRQVDRPHAWTSRQREEIRRRAARL